MLSYGLFLYMQFESLFLIIKYLKSVTVNIKGTCIYISATDFRGFKETKYHCNVEKLCNKYFKQFKWAKYIKQAMIKLLKCSFAVLLCHNFASNSFKII